MPEVDLKETTINIQSNGDHDRFAHYVSTEEMMEAFVNGIPAIALCGKIWIPTRDGSNFPVCKTCEEIYSRLT